MSEQVYVKLLPERFDAIMQIAARAAMSQAEALALQDWQRESVEQVKRDAKAAQAETAQEEWQSHNQH